MKIKLQTIRYDTTFTVDTCNEQISKTTQTKNNNSMFKMKHAEK